MTSIDRDLARWTMATIAFGTAFFASAAWLWLTQ
jgi:hypothetical protein